MTYDAFLEQMKKDLEFDFSTELPAKYSGVQNCFLAFGTRSWRWKDEVIRKRIIKCDRSPDAGDPEHGSP